MPRERAEPDATDFLCCLGCSMMFIDPGLLSAAPRFATEMDEAARTNGAPADAMQSQALRSRFWIARAKTLGGGWEPSSEEMLRLRERYRQ